MYAEVLGTQIFYEGNGQGLPVMFFHGLGGTSNIWHSQRLPLSKYFLVVTVDLPGSGQSAKSEEYSMEHWADQIAGLADAIGIGKFVLVGHSMTTILVQKFAAKYQDRLHGLVLCGPLTELPPEGKEAFSKRVEIVTKDGMGAIADSVISGWLTSAGHQANPALSGLLREMVMRNDPESYVGHCQALMKGSAKEDQPKITCPTLIIDGDQDTTTPLANCQAIAKAIPNARIRIIPSTAHMTMMERPELFNAALMEFLAEF